MNKEAVIAFYNWICKKYGVSICNKSDSTKMKLVAWFLDQMGITAKKEFLENFTTTINQTVYIPFKIGEGEPWQLWGQIGTIIHEVIHAQQARKEGFVRYAFRYLSDKDCRASYEAEAYRSEMVLSFGRNGDYRSPAKIVAALKSYNLEDRHIAYAQKQLEMSIPALQAGAMFHPVTAESINWLREAGHMP